MLTACDSLPLCALPRVCGAFFALVCLGMISHAHAQSHESIQSRVIPVTVTWSELVAREKTFRAITSASVKGQEKTARTLTPLNPESVYIQEPFPIVGLEAAPPDVSGTTGVASPALSAQFEGSPPAGLTPPDTHGAAGPNHLVVALNGSVKTMNKDGSGVSSVGTGTFWSSVPGSLSFIFDPRVFYDPHIGRFVMIYAADYGNINSSVLLAVSASSDPTASWYQYRFYSDGGDGTTSTTSVDFPHLGFTATHLTITANMLRFSDGNFDGINVWSVPTDADFLSGTAATPTMSFLIGVGSNVCPVRTYDAAETIQYLVTPHLPFAGRIRIHTLVHPSTYTYTAYYAQGTAYVSQSTAPQLDSATNLDVGTDRVQSALIRNGSLWCVQAVDVGGLGAAKWWEIDATPGSPTLGDLIQSGTIEDPGGSLHFFYPSIAVNANDDVLIGFSGSSTTTYVGCYYAYRTAATPVGQFDDPVLYKAGLGPYTRVVQSRNRWGDYSNTCVDPADDLTLWTIQEYAAASNNNGTWWGKLGGGADPISVNVTPGTWNLSEVALGSSHGPTSFSAQVGNADTKLEIKATDGAGGWTLGSAPGLNVFSVTVTSPALTLSSSYQTLSPSVTANTSLGFDLTYNAPTSDDVGAGVGQGFDITVRASTP